MTVAVDVAGRELKAGQTVAYCPGGTGTLMRTAKVREVKEKSVTFEGISGIYRRHSAVCIVQVTQ